MRHLFSPVLDGVTRAREAVEESPEPLSIASIRPEFRRGFAEALSLVFRGFVHPTELATLEVRLEESGEVPDAGYIRRNRKQAPNQALDESAAAGTRVSHVATVAVGRALSESPQHAVVDEVRHGTTRWRIAVNPLNTSGALGGLERQPIKKFPHLARFILLPVKGSHDRGRGRRTTKQDVTRQRL